MIDAAMTSNKGISSHLLLLKLNNSNALSGDAFKLEICKTTLKDKEI